VDGLGLDSPDDKGTPRPGVKDFLKRQARSPSNGCVQVVHRDWVFRVRSRLVAGTLYKATLDPSAESIS